MDAPDFWEVLNRAINTGAQTPVRDFDMKIFHEASRLVEDHDIKYDPEVYVPNDDSLADDVWNAGIELFLGLGMYCMSSNRVIRFEESEVVDALKDVSEGVEIGEGSEKRLVTRRGIGSTKPPVIVGGVIESDFPEGETFIKLYQSIAEDPLIDGLYVGPPLHTSEGHTLRMGTPLALHLGRRMGSWAREAIRRAGRPGLHFVSACPSAIADIAACNPEDGVRKSDGLFISVTAELKTDYEALGKTAYALDYGCIRATHGGSIVGGWAGGPEGAAVVSIANFIASVMVYQHNVDPVYGDHGLTRCPGPVPISSINPGMWGTEMQFREIAALCIAGLASGRDLFCGGGIRRYKVKPMLGSALENKFHAELGHASTGIKRDDANELVKTIVQKYEKKITKDGGPWGYTFNEMYDLETLTPRKKFIQLYEKMKNELEDLGLEFKNT